MIPYLRPPSVWPLKRCKFEFSNIETQAGTEFYRNNKRYRMNKWQPFTIYTPKPTRDGLKFYFSDHYPISGMATSFTIPVAESCTVSATFPVMKYKLTPPEQIHTWVPTQTSPPYIPPAPESSFAEVGIGIQRYRSSYWHPIDAMELAIKRGNSYIEVTGLHNVRLQRWSSIGVEIGAKFEARVDAGTLYVSMTEFDLAGTTTNACSWSIPADTSDPTEDVVYNITVFGIAKNGYCDALLARTDITDMSQAFWSPIETVPFFENPESIEILDASPRHPDANVFPQPHIAYVEDGDITCSSSWCDEQWFNVLTFLIDSTVEPFYFYDIEGRQWLCCFADVTGTGRRGYLGRHRQGYTLSMPILVVH